MSKNNKKQTNNSDIMNFIPKKANINTHPIYHNRNSQQPTAESKISTKNTNNKINCFKSYFKKYWHKIKVYAKVHRIIFSIISCTVIILFGGLLIHHAFVSSITYPTSKVSMPSIKQMNTAKHDSLSLQKDLNSYHISQSKQSLIMTNYIRLDTNRQIYVFNKIKTWQKIMPSKNLKLFVTKDAINHND